MSVASTTQITPERLMQFTFGFAPPLIIEAAIRHGVFDALDEGARTVDALSAETRTSPRGLRAILNALVGLQLLARDEEGRYALTPESATFLGAPEVRERDEARVDDGRAAIAGDAPAALALFGRGHSGPEVWKRHERPAAAVSHSASRLSVAAHRRRHV